MNRKLKQLIAIALTVSSVAAFGPTNVFSLITPVSARTSVLDPDELKTLDITTSNGSNLKICSDDYDGKEVDISDIDPDSNKEFYAVLPTGSAKINVSADIKGKNYIAKVFTSKDETAKAYDPAKAYDEGDDIYLTDDVTDLYIRIYKSQDDFDEIKDTDVTDCSNTYIVHIKKEEAFSKKYPSNSDNDSKTNHEYKQSKDIYNDSSNIEKIIVPGSSEIQIKSSQWVKDALGWQYNGSDGTPVKNAWLLDNQTGKYYYVQANGYMITGWKDIDGDWYYFDNSGIMQTGWIQSSDGNWYYLYSSGKMAKDTTVDGYTLSYNGQMK